MEVISYLKSNNKKVHPRISDKTQNNERVIDTFFEKYNDIITIIFSSYCFNSMIKNSYQRFKELKGFLKQFVQI